MQIKNKLIEYPVIWLGLILMALVVPVRPEIFSLINLETLFLSVALLSVLAIGQSFVLITAGIDLSLPAVMSLASVLGASMLTQKILPLGSGTAVFGALVVMLAVGLIIGALQGFSVAVLKMPPFLVTLASLMLISGIAIWFTQSSRIAITPGFIDIWYGRILRIPYPILIVTVLSLAAHFVLRYTVTGRRLYSVGHNLETSRVSGLPINRTILFAYMTSGFCAALASILYTARLYTGSPELVENEVLLDCIGAAVIGGTSLFGGKGKVAGVILGAAFIALITNSLNMLGLRYWHVIMIKGAVILVAASVDAIQRKLVSPERQKV